MSESAADMAFACDLFRGLGPVNARRMFGGVGLYAGGAMFGLIDDGRIYLKTDAALKDELVAAGSVAWIYAERTLPKGGVAPESTYWSLPESALDDPDEALALGRRALAVAEAVKAANPKRGRGARSARRT